MGACARVGRGILYVVMTTVVFLSIVVPNIGEESGLFCILPLLPSFPSCRLCRNVYVVAKSNHVYFNALIEDFCLYILQVNLFVSRRVPPSSYTFWY